MFRACLFCGGGRVLRGCLRVNATGLRVRFWFCGLMGVWVVVCSACVGFVRLPERPV